MTLSLRRAPVAAIDPIERIRPISEREFALFQGLILHESGIYLAPAKKALLVGRLSKRLRALELSTFEAYYRRIVDDDDREERVAMLDCVSTNETHFFREPRHFAFLEQSVFPSWRAEAERGARARRVRVWSCACSTGEEPFSLAMTLLRAFPPGSGWDLEILASDLSTAVLARARTATWALERSAELTTGDLRAFMLKGTGPQEGFMRAGPELRALVRFARLNLNDASYPGLGRFDLLFCRNVLMYFDPRVKEQVVGRLLGHLAPGGHLFIGHAESLSGTSLPLRCVVPTIYQAEPPEPRAGRRGRA